MPSKIAKFVSFAKSSGLSNAFVYSLYKLYPKQFSLLEKKIKSTINPNIPVSKNEYMDMIDSVLDYVDWASFGGSIKPLKNTTNVKTFIWFVPDWTNVWGGGHYTLFRFANFFAAQNTRNIIYIYNNQRHLSSRKLQSELDDALPECKLEVIVDPMLLPECTAAIASTWQSAFHVKAFPFAKTKFYFMQDYESLFYPFGTSSLQANSTYSFGFHGITGGTWLKSRYESHGGAAQSYLFAADKNIFYPSRSDNIVRPQVRRVFFYGRPSTERRCFELGMAALKKISEYYPDIEIIIAGLDLSHTPPFKATLMGNLPLIETGDLYRSCDIGIAFSATNLSYLPVELMASGVPVISNNGPQVEWLLTEKNTCLVDPAPLAVFDAFKRLYDSYDIRQQLALDGLKTMSEISWDNEMSKIYSYVEKIVGIC
ncbi:glycosyltransferase family 4 protein [Acidithiobacillus sp. CV18-2]|nr:glycosyltransferase family 4 protein [Acidithiobacillus sp. CV18-3]MBU2758342.1 glycosyltransferase family 4 protein [Acidithiobacillus sp. BN09-2]MBU2776242.1 glycosyltransferase family 4 protein [Acidithiobacillus sp. CV18-2]MBU2800222.1 glycosyltransferase family 4 protein [Acidithiobacillus sp. VAN18-4]